MKSDRVGRSVYFDEKVCVRRVTREEVILLENGRKSEVKSEEILSGRFKNQGRGLKRFPSAAFHTVLW